MTQAEVNVSRLLDAAIFLCEGAPWPFVQHRAKDIKAVLELEITRLMTRRKHELARPTRTD